jgi:mRNA-degrading endonuclease RelE of RelBE toxin-antitoxin system
MQNKNDLFEIKFANQFQQDIKRLAKKFRQIKSDKRIQEILAEFAES